METYRRLKTWGCWERESAKVAPAVMSSRTRSRTLLKTLWVGAAARTVRLRTRGRPAHRALAIGDRVLEDGHGLVQVRGHGEDFLQARQAARGLAEAAFAKGDHPRSHRVALDLVAIGAVDEHAPDLGVDGKHLVESHP